MQIRLEKVFSQSGWVYRLVRMCLWVGHWPYRAVIRVRNFLYDRKLLKVHSLPLPVISVGNITCGGTGKTPAVIFLAKMIRQMGFTVAVLMRPYKTRSGQPGDEQLVIRQALGDVPVIAQADRVAGGRTAIEQYDADFLLLDDGFQHRRLGRDFNIVLIDGTCPFGYGYVLPAGLLREPPNQLQRADLMIISRSNAVSGDQLWQLSDRLHEYNPSCPIMCGWHQPKCLIGPDDTVHSLEEIAGRSALVFCGLGRPEAFVAGLTDLGVNVVDLVCYPDHYHYKQADVDMLAQRAELVAARFMLTTAKDWVKLRELDLPNAVPMLYLEIEFCLPAKDKTRLEEKISQLADQLAIIKQVS